LIVINQKAVTIERHIIDQQEKHPGATGELTRLLHQIALSAKMITHEVRRAGLLDILGDAGMTNVQDESVQKLDVIADDILYTNLDHAGVLCCMASEERAKIIEIPSQFQCGKYTLAFDPLDGSSNIDANVSVGTIFSVHRKITPGDHGTEEDLLQPGSNQIVAGYVVYGSSTILVYTSGHGVFGFTLEPSIGEFLLSHPNIQIPTRGEYFSVNMGNYHFWSAGVKKYVDYLTTPDKTHGKPYTSRYIGSMVADVHRTLLYGGIFMYPMDLKDPKKPKGKLRMLYEAAPMAKVIEQAGGLATNGKNNLLDIVPRDLHERTPLYVGSRDDVLEVGEYITKYDK
jgi:fructose-1,6-bisphosphatase I